MGGHTVIQFVGLLVVMGLAVYGVVTFPDWFVTDDPLDDDPRDEPVPGWVGPAVLERLERAARNGGRWWG